MSLTLQNRKCVPAKHSVRAGSLDLGSQADRPGVLMMLMLAPHCRPAEAESEGVKLGGDRFR